MSERRRTAIGALLLIVGAVLLDVGLIRLLEAAECGGGDSGLSELGSGDGCEAGVGLKVAILIAGFVLGFAGLLALNGRNERGDQLAGSAPVVAAVIPILNGIVLLIGFGGGGGSLYGGELRGAVIAFAIGSILCGAVTVPRAIAVLRGT